MNKVISTLSAVAIAAVVAAPAFAEELPTNNTISGGQGEVKAEGGGLFALGAGLSGAAIAGIIAAVVVVGGIASSSNSTN
jgi:hypothetical protein